MLLTLGVSCQIRVYSEASCQRVLRCNHVYQTHASLPPLQSHREVAGWLDRVRILWSDWLDRVRILCSDYWLVRSCQNTVFWLVRSCQNTLFWLVRSCQNTVFWLVRSCQNTLFWLVSLFHVWILCSGWLVGFSCEHCILIGKSVSGKNTVLWLVTLFQVRILYSDWLVCVR